MSLRDRANVVDDGVVRDVGSNSPSGVQIIGAMRPSAARTVPIDARVTACQRGVRRLHILIDAEERSA
jgi:hypothetical protein